MADVPDLAVDLCERGHVVASWRQLVLQVYMSEARAASVERATLVMQAHRRAHPGGIGAIVVVSHMGKPPDDASRAAWLRQMQGPLLVARAGLVLFEGASARASLVRSVVTGLIVLARRRLPIHIAATAAEGLPWFLSEMERAGTPCGSTAEVTAAIEAARGRAVAAV